MPKPSDARPKHGPGSVAWFGPQGALISKHKLQPRYTRLMRYFRPVPWFASLRDIAERPEKLTEPIRCEFGLSRLAFVEKDSLGPRVIGLEPAEYMWCQQALKNLLYDHIEQHSGGKGQINFTDQTVNRMLALNWEDWDTLDMKDASDRVSLSLVEDLFKHTQILPWLKASRTPGVALPSGRVLLYKKFAPMGSATCFPVEAIVFYSLAVATLMKAGYPFLVATKKSVCLR
jgi:hypothetical protein